MQIVRVIPIRRGIFKAELTYFTTQTLSPGSLVTITIKGKKMPGLVTAASPAADLKSALRQADYSLKRIGALKSAQFFAPSTMEAAKRTAEYHASAVGAVLASLVPRAVLEHADITDAPLFSTPPPPPPSAIKPERLCLQDTDEERLTYYKALCRETLARKRSALICLPGQAEAERLAEALTKGIGNYVCLIHHRLPATKLLARWQQVAHEPHALVVVTTPTILALPRADWGAIIVEQEASSVYKQMTRPHIDSRRFAEYLAEATNSKLLLGGTVLRVETVYRSEQLELVPAAPLKQRLPSRIQSTIVPATSSEILASDTVDLVQEAVERGDKTLVFCPRRGVAPLVVCQDCGSASVCPACGAPLVLHSNTSARCHHCGEKLPAPKQCTHCTGWRLVALGTGSERVVQELATLMPSTSITHLSSDSAHTVPQINKLLRPFKETPGAILVGTELALNHLPLAPATIITVATDALLTLPDFRIRARVFALLVHLRSLAKRRLAIQTRRPEEVLYKHATSGAAMEFYREEIAERHTYHYPPFSILIKISYRGTKERAASEAKKLQNLLVAYEPVAYPALANQPDRDYKMNVLIRATPEQWPNTELADQLQNLPPSFNIDIDPDNIH